MVAQFDTHTTTYGPALQKMVNAFPQAIEQSNGWWSHPDNPTFDFRENEDGSISIHSWTGRTQQEILTMGGLQVADIYPRGYKAVKVRARLDVLELAHAKCLPWQFLFSLGLQSEYRYHGYSNVKVPYFNADGSQHTKIRVRKAVEGDYKQCWDENTPGDVIPYGLHRIDTARHSGYVLIGEGESDGWACWFYNLPYLGIPGADMQKTLKHLDIGMLPPKIYILLESDQKQKLLENGQGFYKNIHRELRTHGYTGEIFCTDFKQLTGHKDPSALHITLWKEGRTDQFQTIIHQALEQAIPANDEQEDIISPFVIQDERVFHALLQKRLQDLYALAPEITDMDDMEQARIKLAALTIWGKDFPSREFDCLLRAAKIENERRRQGDPCPISAQDLMRKQFSPIEYIVPDVLPMGLIILGGKQKIGKSWLDLNLSLAVASGGVALGKYHVKQGEVLYLALEDTERRLQDRIGQLLGPGNEAPKGLYIETKWPRMDHKGIADLEKWLQAHPNTRLVIIDPWVKVKPRVQRRNGETGYDADYEALAGIKALADKYNICVLIQFHLRKQNADDPFDEVNATTGATACADGLMSIKRVRGETTATLYASGRDYKEDVNLALSFKDGRWKILEEDARYYTLSPERKEVIDFLNGAQGPMKPKDIGILLNLPPNNVRQLLMNMRADNQVEDRGEGYISLIASPQNLAKKDNSDNSDNTYNSDNTVSFQGSDQAQEDETSENEVIASTEVVDTVMGVSPVSSVIAVIENSSKSEGPSIPVDLFQEYRALYQQIQKLPTTNLAPHGTILWHVPESGFDTGMIPLDEYAHRLILLGKSGNPRKFTVGRDEMLRKLEMFPMKK